MEKTIKIIVTMLGYVISLSSLSVMVISRKRIGQNVFLPWGMKISYSFARVFMRFWMVAFLLFAYVRLFFIIEVKNRNDPSPFDASKTLWELFSDFDLHYGFGSHILLYYYSYIAVFLGLIQIICLEIYYKTHTSISRLALGESFLFSKLEGKNIFGCTIDNFLVSGIFEPAFVIAAGYLIQLIKGYSVLGIFIIMAGIAMFIQGQLSRLDHREQMQNISDGYKTAERLTHSNEGFKEKKESNSINAKRKKGGARFA